MAMVTPTYNSWRGMIQRCYNPNHFKYNRYGGRGIKTCKRWRKFKNFLADMGERPEGMTIERINNDKGYRKGNCRWATRKEQAQNRHEPIRRSDYCKKGHLKKGSNLRIWGNARRCYKCWKTKYEESKKWKLKSSRIV